MDSLFVVLLVIGVITYGIRLSFILLFGRMNEPQWLKRSLRFVPPAVLSAIIFPEVLRPAGDLDVSFGNPRLLAALLAAVVAWRTKNIVLTIAAGMAALLALQFLMG